MIKSERSILQEAKYSEDDEQEDDEEEEESQDEEVIPSDDDEEDQEVPNWNSFKEIPHESESISMADTSIIDGSIQILKLFAYTLTFGLVLSGAVLAKSILLLMTSQLAPDRMITVELGSMFLGLKLPEVEKYVWVWALLISFSIPELGVLLRSIRIAWFKGYVADDENLVQEMERNFISFKYIALVTWVMETLHVVGVAIFIFEVLPQMDVAKGIMLTNSVCLVPGLLSVGPNIKNYSQQKLKVIADIFAFLFQLTGLFAWPIIFGPFKFRVLFTSLSLILISCGWWMNYVSEESPVGFVKFLAKIKDRLKKKKVLLYKLYIGLSIWKILLFFGSSLFILMLQGTNISDFFHRTGEAFADREMEANQVETLTWTLKQATYTIPSVGTGIFWIIGAQVFSAYICYIFSKFACRVMIQPFSFAFPCALVVPITLLLIMVTTGLRNQNHSVFSDFLPLYVFFNSPQIYDVQKFFIDEYGWIWILWLVSQIWITFHIWVPRCERLSKTETLFATPMYSAFLVDQSIALNRRRDEVEIREKISEGIPPHIIACATMWHEKRPEMLEMLKSLLRMDNDQCLKMSAKNNVNDPEAEANYYTFESHIFFDDAFELESEESTRTVINGFVKDFIRVVKKATKDVYGTDDVWIKPPLKYSTPYGGRLEYTMPGENKLYVHLKDRDKIRHKKRWSQVMYMYYLLGYKLMELPISYEKKMERAENTFILALDGDIDFKPDAVLLLVDLMKKNTGLGAACGRIHPIGSGFMVWYQLFEYAIGHWLQKATEHMIGCVLCSPGCFSLFRAKALMSQNVMRKYTTKAEEARHYVQYDQGEDRWLCTLLLQRGYRVEYSAASDAYTRCPETFNEFYTQRRRWIPSTMANIIDLLSDYKRTVRINNDISFLYVLYQMIMLVGTVLGPGTILLMLVGAFNAAFKIDNWTAFYYNLIPIIGFMLCCLFTSGKFQLSAALIISLGYGLIMMAVLVGIIMEIKDDGLLSPSALFFFVTAGEIIIAAVLHPQEVYCLLCGVVYYVTIPSMYLLLIIYSVCNLNVVSWGTREVAKKKTKADLENEKKEAEIAEKKAQNTKLFGILDSFSNNQQKETSGALELSFANLFRCICCTSEKPNPATEQFVKIGETLNVLKQKLDDIERSVDGEGPLPTRRSTIRMSTYSNRVSQNSEVPRDKHQDDNLLVEITKEEDEDDMRDDLFNPYWIEDKDLKKSKFEVLSTHEITFWKELIKKYLTPLSEDKEKQKEIKKNLRELRDKMVVTFFMLNALFVVVVFLLQVNKDQIYLQWPLGAKNNITFNKVTYEITIQKTYLQLEPVGLTFIFFFASVLVIQFVAMLFHRFETLCHLLSNTPLTILRKKRPNFTNGFRERTNETEVFQLSEYSWRYGCASDILIKLSG